MECFRWLNDGTDYYKMTYVMIVERLETRDLIRVMNGVQEVGGSNPLAPTCKPRCNNMLRRGFFVERRPAPRRAGNRAGKALPRTLGAYNGIALGCCLSRGPQVKNLLAHPLFPQQSQEVRSVRTPEKPWYRASKDAWYAQPQ